MTRFETGPQGQTIILDSLRWRADVRNISFQISLWLPIHITNSVDKTELSHYFKSLLFPMLLK